ncbi:unnamed protein product [Prorocentrum cordatum]|nr:unnamed protein product [Polarella glacialis]
MRAFAGAQTGNLSRRSARRWAERSRKGAPRGWTERRKGKEEVVGRGLTSARTPGPAANSPRPNSTAAAQALHPPPIVSRRAPRGPDRDRQWRSSPPSRGLRPHVAAHLLGGVTRTWR